MEYNRVNMMYAGDSENMKRLSLTASLNAYRLMKLINSPAMTGRRSSIIKEPISEAVISNSTKSIEGSHYSHHYHYHNPVSFENKLMLYDQMKKYAPNKSFDPLIKVPIGKFIRMKVANASAYSPCFLYSKADLLKKRNYACRNQFTSKTPHELTRNKLSQSMGSSLSIKKLSTSQIDKLDDISNQAEENLKEFKKEIMRNETVRVSQTSKLNYSKSSLNISKIQEDFKFKKEQSGKISKGKIIKDNYNKVKLNLDKKGKSILREVLNQIKYEDDKLNRPDLIDFDIENLQVNNRLKKEFALVRYETMQMKRKIKGQIDIEKPKEVDTIKKLIKGMICRNIRGDDFLEDLIKRKNILRFKNFNYPERRFMAMHQKKKFKFRR